MDPNLIIWIAIFLGALALLVKGADWLLDSANKIGRAIGLSPFVVGVFIVGLGTSLPELASSLAAVFSDAPDSNHIVVANAIGSNIANILLVIGIAAVIGRGLSVSKNLIDLDIPLLAIASTTFYFIVDDSAVVFREALLLLALGVIYMVYIFKHSDGSEEEEEGEPEKVSGKDVLILIVGIAALVVGAKYLIEAAIEISKNLGVGVEIISLVAIAFGTSLPELLVSAKAALKGNAEVALGNIFGSNVFNLLLVVGIPGLFANLPIDRDTADIGLPIMLAATFLFIISGISRKIHAYEGAAYVVLYVVFIGKIFGFI